MIKESLIGNRIKKLRVERDLTLKQLAKSTGFTSGYLSKVENSQKSPPVSTLIVLADFMGIGMDSFFAEKKEKTSFMLTKKRDRQIMKQDPDFEYNYIYEPLVPDYPNRKMNPYILTVPATPRGINKFEHKGEELIFLLEGEAHFTHGDKTVLLKEGDCVYFDSSYPHFGISLGEKEAKCLIVILSDE